MSTFLRRRVNCLHSSRNLIESQGLFGVSRFRVKMFIRGTHRPHSVADAVCLCEKPLPRVDKGEGACASNPGGRESLCSVETRGSTKMFSRMLGVLARQACPPLRVVTRARSAAFLNPHHALASRHGELCRADGLSQVDYRVDVARSLAGAELVRTGAGRRLMPGRRRSPSLVDAWALDVESGGAGGEGFPLRPSPKSRPTPSAGLRPATPRGVAACRSSARLSMVS